MKLFLIILALLPGVTVQAANIHVAKTGNDTTGTGATNAPYLTVTKAESVMGAGDNCYINPGTYEEAPTVNIAGTVTSRINFIGQSGVILRGIHLSGASYVSIINIEFTQVDGTWGNAPVSMAGTSVGNWWIDNYIHNTWTLETLSGIHSTGTQRDCIFRGNIMYYLGSVNSEGRITAINSDYSTTPPARMLAEYNTISRALDYITLYGGTNKVRNNCVGDHVDTYWSNNGDYHADSFQPGSDGQQAGTRHHIYERNYATNNWCMGGSSAARNGHFGLFQDSGGFGDTNILLRGNVVAGFSDGAIGGRNFPPHSGGYNNTFHLITNSVFFVYNSAASVNLAFFNNIISTFSGTSGGAIELLNGAAGIVAGNLGYLAGTETAGYYASTANPLFADAAVLDLRITSSSPARALGTNVIKITSAAGSGTTFAVNDPQLLSDGWGLVEGDLITVNGTTVRILTNNWGNSNITVSASVTWGTDEPVHWGVNSAEDAGAYPYGAVMLTSATISHNGTTHTVSTVGDTRGVFFYVNGIPTEWDYTPPYQTTSSGTVTAKAAALYAQQQPLIAATEATATIPALGISGNLNISGDLRL